MPRARLQLPQNQPPETTTARVEMYRCEICGYGRPEVSAPCHLCETMDALGQERARNATLGVKLAQAQAEVNAVVGMRDCLEFADTEDLLALKEIAYMYREDPRGVTIAPMLVGQESAGVTANAFALQWRAQGEKKRTARQRVFGMSSLGGIAFAGEFFDACRTYKSQNAAAMLLRAMGPFLEVNSS